VSTIKTSQLRRIINEELDAYSSGWRRKQDVFNDLESLSQMIDKMKTTNDYIEILSTLKYAQSSFIPEMISQVEKIVSK